jgi:hypothetical protein
MSVWAGSKSAVHVVAGAPAKVRGPIAGTGAETWVTTNPGAYQDLARRYLTGLSVGTAHLDDPSLAQLAEEGAD